jgi:hypothetical protein
MENFIYLMCTTPFEELCAQVNEDNYRDNARIESRVYLNQLLRTLGENPVGTLFQNEWCNHDAGQYLDIRFYYDDEVQQHVLYAGLLEAGVVKWDETALKELQGAKYELPLEKVIPINRNERYLRKAKGA